MVSIPWTKVSFSTDDDNVACVASHRGRMFVGTSAPGTGGVFGRVLYSSIGSSTWAVGGEFAYHIRSLTSHTYQGIPYLYALKMGSSEPTTTTIWRSRLGTENDWVQMCDPMLNYAEGGPTGQKIFSYNNKLWCVGFGYISSNYCPGIHCSGLLPYTYGLYYSENSGVDWTPVPELTILGQTGASIAHIYGIDYIIWNDNLYICSASHDGSLPHEISEVVVWKYTKATDSWDSGTIVVKCDFGTNVEANLPIRFAVFNGSLYLLVYNDSFDSIDPTYNTGNGYSYDWEMYNFYQIYKLGGGGSWSYVGSVSAEGSYTAGAGLFPLTYDSVNYLAVGTFDEWNVNEKWSLELSTNGSTWPVTEPYEVPPDMTYISGYEPDTGSYLGSTGPWITYNGFTFFGGGGSPAALWYAAYTPSAPINTNDYGPNNGPEDDDPPICWNYTAKYKGSGKLFKKSGPGAFPKKLWLPSNVDRSTGRMIDDGKEIDPDHYEVF